MRRIFGHNLSSGLIFQSRFQYYKPKLELHAQCSAIKQSLFKKKTFPEIINIIKNPDNPYPKNSAYFYALLECILDESNENSKIMIDHGDVIHVFLQQIMERIKNMGAKQLSEILSLLRFRPKALRFDKELLITMHVRFESRINELIELNSSNHNLSKQQTLTMDDLKDQIQGLFYLKKNTSILNRILKFSQRLMQTKRQNKQRYSVQELESDQRVFYEIIQVINENLDDTIDPVRESIAQFIWQNYTKKTLPYNKQILRMIVKCKFYKNYPIVRNQDWLHDYVYSYLRKVVNEHDQIDIQQYVSVLKNVTNYVMHIDEESFESFMKLIEQAYQLAKSNLLGICYINDKQQLAREVNTISHQIKLIPSYLYLKNYYKVSTTNVQNANKVDSNYIKSVINQIKPIIKKFVLCYFDKVQKVGLDGEQTLWLTNSIQNNIEILNNIVKNQQQPQKLLLKSVENLLNTVTVFKDYNIININIEFSLLLIQAEIIYCILCRHWISDEVRYLRLLEHSVYVIGEFERELQNNNPKVKAHEERVKRIKDKMVQQLTIYDTTDKTYKQFTVLRLVAVLKCMNMKPKYLGDFYRNVKIKKPNIYVQTLSRTMLKVYNYQQVIEAFDMMFQGKIVVKEIELGRIVFLSSKQPQLLKYWIHTNRKNFVSKVCFCRRIINNIVSIIRMDNLEINRNSIQLLSEIVIENKLFEIDNHSISNHQQSNALKRILCNNFSILFRYSKMDSMIDDIFVVHKNIPTIFRNKFSHIEAIKILSFSAYLSEQQSIFYINRQNKNALFKYVIMLMKKDSYCEKRNPHYLFGDRYNEQSMMLLVMDRIIEQYWPDNKLTNKGMPFYAQFLNYYTKINQFGHLVSNENTIFLIIKEILQDFKQVQTKADMKYIVSRMQHNYQRLHFLSIFQNETTLSNTLQNVLNSMNFIMDIKIFGEFVKIIEGWIKAQIEVEKKNREKGIKPVVKPWKQHAVDKHIINRMVIEEMQSLDFVTDYEILSLMTVDVLVHGTRAVVNNNMELLVKRLLKINPISAKLITQAEFSNNTNTNEQPLKKQFPFQLFKLLMSNLNIYLFNRDKRLTSGKQLLNEQTSPQRVTQWLIKCLLTYCRQIQNNQQMQHIIKYMNNWNIDILALVKNKFLDTKFNLDSLVRSYFDVDILAMLWTQNGMKFLEENQLGEGYEFTKGNILNYINVLLVEFQQSHIINNYGVYFPTQGQKVLNIIRSLLQNILMQQPQTTQHHKQALRSLKIVKQLTDQFTLISNKAHKYNRVKNGKYNYLYNEDQGDVVDMFASNSHSHNNRKHHRNHHNHESPDNLSKHIKLSSFFSQILSITSLINFNKRSVLNFSTQHKQMITKINKFISKKQKELFVNSELSYFTDTEPLLEEKVFEQLGLKLMVRKSNEKDNLTIYYVVNERQSMLYDFAYKKRRRLVGEEQLIVDYIQTIVSNLMNDKETVNVKVKVIPGHLSKAELKRLILN